MAKRIAVVSGTALVPGISKNGRLYTRETIARAVARAQDRIGNGTLPLTDRLDELQPLSQKTHHAADDDSARIVGRITSMTLGEDGSAKFTADIANTSKGRDIAALADTSDGKPAFLRGVSIRGAWMDKPRTETVDGKSVQTADDLILDGLDYTGSPGVPGAVIDSCVPVSESTTGSHIYESVQEATVTADTEAEEGNAVEQPPPLAEAKTPMSKRGSGLTGTGGPYADPGYLADKKQRYELGSKKLAKSAWSYINQKDNAAQYTANQLKRIKQRIVKALKGFGVEVNTAEHYLIDPVTALTESTTLAECMDCYGEQDPREAGSFYVTLTNGPVTVSVSSYRVDPADLDLIGRAAMDGACKALATLDPDMDGDIDAPGADAEDTDHDMASANVPGTACPCGCGCAIPLEPGDCPCTCVCAVCGGEPMGEDAPDAVETAPDPAAAAVEPAPQAAADPTTETEEPAVSEPTTAVEPTQAAPTPAAVTLTGEQFAQLLAAASAPRPVEAAPAAAAPVAETAPATAPAAPAPIAETQEQMIERLVSDGITKGVQKLVSTGALNPSRKGLAGRPVTETGEEAALTEYGVPEDWPQKPLHQYTAQENRLYTDRALAEHILGDSLYTGRR